MKYASPSIRFYASVIDISLFTCIFFFLQRMVWELIPKAEIPFQVMQFFNKNHWNSFIISSSIGFLIYVLYFNFLPATRIRTTIGQKLFDITMVASNGELLTLKDSARITLVSMFKFFLVFGAGPLFAYLEFSSYVSGFFLIFSLPFIIATNLVAYENPNGVYIWERLGKYHYISSSNSE